MSWRYVLANLAAGNQPLSILDQMFNDAGALSTTQCAASGTNTITLTPNSFTPPIGAYANLQAFGFTAQNSSSGAVTLQIAALGFLPVYIPGAIRQAASGDINAGTFYQIVFLQALNSGGGGFIVVSERNTTEAMVSATITGGVVTILKQINVASFVVSGAPVGGGSFQVNFANPMADSNYVMAVSWRGNQGQPIIVYENQGIGRNQSRIVITAANANTNTGIDPQQIDLTFKD